MNERKFEDGKISGLYFIHDFTINQVSDTIIHIERERERESDERQNEGKNKRVRKYQERERERKEKRIENQEREETSVVLLQPRIIPFLSLSFSLFLF